MAAAAGHRARWIGVWALLLLWFLGLVFGWGGNAAHLLLLAALALLVYELLVTDAPAG